MGAIVRLTSQLVRVTSAPTLQPLYLAVDVLEFDQVDLICSVVAVEGSTSTEYLLALWTGMQTDTEDGWHELIEFPQFNGGAGFQKLTLTSGCLRYLRWSVKTLPGSLTGVSFFIEGVGRRV